MLGGSSVIVVISCGLTFVVNVGDIGVTEEVSGGISVMVVNCVIGAADVTGKVSETKRSKILNVYLVYFKQNLKISSKQNIMTAFFILLFYFKLLCCETNKHENFIC